MAFDPTSAVEDTFDPSTASLEEQERERRRLGKITDYGQRNDPHGDSLTRAGKNAIGGQLSPASLAVSPDIEQEFRKQGVKIGDWVNLTLDDGSQIARRWDDRTAQDGQILAGKVPNVNKPLRGRFDLFSPDGPHPNRDAAIVGFSRIGNQQPKEPEPPAAFDPDTAEPEPEQSTARNVTNTLGRGALEQGFYAGVEGVSRLVANTLPVSDNPALVAAVRPLTMGVPVLLSPQEQELARGYADATADVRQEVKQALPVDESFERSLGGQITAGLGQAIGTLPTYTVPGLGPALAVGQMYDEGYRDALDHGASERDAHQAALAYTPAAALDIIGDKLIIGKILKPLKGKVTVGQIVKSAATTAASEGATEAGQQVWLNAVAKLKGYDPNRKLDDEVMRSLVVGAVVGGTVTATGQTLAKAVGGGQETAGGFDPTTATEEPLAGITIPESVGPSADPLAAPSTSDAPQGTGSPESSAASPVSEASAPSPSPFDTQTPAASEGPALSAPRSRPTVELDAPTRQLLAREYSFPKGMLDYLDPADAAEMLADRPGSRRAEATLQAAMRRANDRQKAAAIQPQPRTSSTEVAEPSAAGAADPTASPAAPSVLDVRGPAMAGQVDEPFSKQPAAQTAHIQKLVRDQWRALGERNGPEVLVADTVADIPARLAGETARQAVQSGSIVEAFFISSRRKDGTTARRIVLVRDGAEAIARQRGISPDKRIQQLALHEVVHHYGSLGHLFPKTQQRACGIL